MAREILTEWYARSCERNPLAKPSYGRRRRREKKRAVGSSKYCRVCHDLGVWAPVSSARNDEGQAARAKQMCRRHYREWEREQMQNLRDEI